MQINSCDRCDEDAVLVKLDFQEPVEYFVRVRRFSKCIEYRKRGGSSKTTCKTECRKTAEEATDLWNKRRQHDQS